jgi:hypothetical protein
MPLRPGDKLGPYDRLQELPFMNNSTRERGSPLGCFPGQPTPRRYDRVVEVLGVRHYSELAGQKRFDDVAVRCERDGARP